MQKKDDFDSHGLKKRYLTNMNNPSHTSFKIGLGSALALGPLTAYNTATNYKNKLGVALHGAAALGAASSLAHQYTRQNSFIGKNINEIEPAELNDYSYYLISKDDKIIDWSGSKTKMIHKKELNPGSYINKGITLRYKLSKDL